MFHRQQGQISHKGNNALEKQKQRSYTTAPQVNGKQPATLIQRAKDDPSSLTSDEVLTLQGTMGNLAVSRLLAGRSATKVQTKLTIGQPGDKYEQEADRVASQVVEQIHAPASTQSTQGQSLQLQEQAEEKLQAKSVLQRREEIAVGEASTDLESAINRALGSGQPLDVGLQRSMGQAMGADFSGVKVHTDTQADQLNQSIQAKAFTTGKDVFFRQGEYSPRSSEGQELIAHELTHVVQQKGSAVQSEIKAKQRTHRTNERTVMRTGGYMRPEYVDVAQESAEKHFTSEQLVGGRLRDDDLWRNWAIQNHIERGGLGGPQANRNTLIVLTAEGWSRLQRHTLFSVTESQLLEFASEQELNSIIFPLDQSLVKGSIETVRQQNGAYEVTEVRTTGYTAIFSAHLTENGLVVNHFIG